jgi:hypothetical protein
LERERVVSLVISALAAGVAGFCLWRSVTRETPPLAVANERAVEDQARQGQQPRPAVRGKVIEAERIVLLDALGQRSASVAMDEGGTGIAFYNAAGLKLGTLGVGEEGATTLLLFDRKERSGARLEVADGAAQFSLVGGPGAGTVGVFADRGGSTLALFDNHGRSERLHLGVREGNPEIAIFDGHNKHARIRVGLYPELAGLSIADANANVRLFAGLQEGPKLFIADQERRILFNKP